MSLELPAPVTMEVNRKYQWKVFAILLAACMVSVVAVLPYSLTMQSETLNAAELPMPLPVFLAIQVLQSVVLFSLVGGVGYLLATKIGLGLPFVEGRASGQPVVGKLPRIALVAAILGVLIGLIIVALDLWVFGPQMQAELAEAGVNLPDSVRPSAWQGFLASFYGGITEEVLLRLGIMTFFAWLGRFINRTADNRPTLPVLWVANILAAVLFGLGHLPAAATMGIPITAFFIVRTVFLNGILGVVAGWLYWRWGLESAIVLHFSGDIVLHVLLPLVSG